ncbi:hypothetical protein EI94DRAFT_1701544 [Lactarius quietus]|nr:hypothetical protein EI94DRAFT_1701544 [Lactarius quietus]
MSHWVNAVECCKWCGSGKVGYGDEGLEVTGCMQDGRLTQCSNDRGKHVEGHHAGDSLVTTSSECSFTAAPPFYLHVAAAICFHTTHHNPHEEWEKQTQNDALHTACCAAVTVQTEQELIQAVACTHIAKLQAATPKWTHTEHIIQLEE